MKLKIKKLVTTICNRTPDKSRAEFGKSHNSGLLYKFFHCQLHI